jgi:hypothetical protein
VDDGPEGDLVGWTMTMTDLGNREAHLWLVSLCSMCRARTRGGGASSPAFGAGG